MKHYVVLDVGVEEIAICVGEENSQFCLGSGPIDLVGRA